MKRYGAGKNGTADAVQEAMILKDNALFRPHVAGDLAVFALKVLALHVLVFLFRKKYRGYPSCRHASKNSSMNCCTLPNHFFCSWQAS